MKKILEKIWEKDFEKDFRKICEKGNAKIRGHRKLSEDARKETLPELCERLCLLEN